MPPTTFGITHLTALTTLQLSKQENTLKAELPPLPDGATRKEWRYSYLTSVYGTPVVIEEPR